MFKSDVMIYAHNLIVFDIDMVSFIEEVLQSVMVGVPSGPASTVSRRLAASTPDNIEGNNKKKQE